MNFNEEIQLVGNAWSPSSCGKKPPKYFKWSKDNKNIKVFVDYAITQNTTNNSNNVYGWICESKAIIHSVVDEIKLNLGLYKSNFKKIFTYDEDLISLDNNLFSYCYAGSNIPWTPDSDFGLHKKTKLVSFLCSPKNMTEGHRYRLNWADKLKNQVDMYGGACGSKVIGVSDRKKTEALNDYMFSITIENSLVDCYFTEKLTDCFVNGVIPVYHGSKKIIKHFNQNGIIFLEKDFNTSMLSEDLYYSKMDAIKENFEIAASMIMADDLVFLKIKEYCK